MSTVKCPICEKVFTKELYTQGFIHCSPWGCGIFFDPETRKVMQINNDGQVILDTKQIKELL